MFILFLYHNNMHYTKATRTTWKDPPTSVSVEKKDFAMNIMWMDFALICHSVFFVIFTFLKIIPIYKDTIGTYIS